MDGSQFDALVRSWGRGPRRSVLQLIAGTSLGAALLGSLGIEDASAKCAAPGKKCKKKNGKKKKCCGGAKCKGKKCKCTNGGVGCGKTCCIPGQVCVVTDGVPGCSNGSIPVGLICDAAQPGACTSGVCGCTCNGETCICRTAECFAAGADCEATGTAGCCQGFCLAGDPNTCQVC
jgi:hypothetical protein